VSRAAEKSASLPGPPPTTMQLFLLSQVPAVRVPAVAGSCCHPERSEGSRRTQLTTTARIFQPIFFLLLSVLLPPANNLRVPIPRVFWRRVGRTRFNRPTFPRHKIHHSRKAKLHPRGTNPKNQVGKGRARQQAGRKALPALRSHERSSKAKATHSIAIVPAIIFLLPNSAQKTHVKPQNQLNATNKTRSSWHFSSTQSDILNIDQKNKQAPDILRG
jgi:hypothetical protein